MIYQEYSVAVMMIRICFAVGIHSLWGSRNANDLLWYRTLECRIREPDNRKDMDWESIDPDSCTAHLYSRRVS